MPVSDLRLRSHVHTLPILETGAAAKAALDRQGVADVVRLNSNEGPYGAFPSAIDAMVAAASQLNRYPDPTCHGLVNVVAPLHGVTPDHILVTPGSTNLIFLLAAALLEEGDELVYPWPSFPQYKNAALHQRARPVAVPLDRFVIDLARMRAAIGPRTRMLVIANPNNPTGTTVEPAALEQFIDEVPSHVLVVLDEAYAEYAPAAFNGVESVKAGRSAIVLRTFSKVYGLAGLRIGYGIAAPELVAALSRVQPPFAVNHLALAAATASVSEQALVAERVRANVDGLEQLYAGFRELGLEWVPSSANFVLVDVGMESREAVRGLVERGVLVRPGHGYDYPTHIRVTVGRPHENAAFLDALRHVLARRP